jgi:hypothetical protein
LFIGAAAVCLAWCLLALLGTAPFRGDEAWLYSRNNLQQIDLALHSYHDTYGRLPPAVVRGPDGRPLYSWRVLLLPFLEQENLYAEFRLDEPWDGPHNRTLQMPWCYRPLSGGSDGPGLTHYQVFVGPGTAFERDGLTWADFPGGLDRTLLVVEAAEPVPWSKPADLAYAPDGPLPPLGGVAARPVRVLGWEVGRRPGFNACFADGSARFLRSPTDERILRTLIGRHGGKKADPARLE